MYHLVILCMGTRTDMKVFKTRCYGLWEDGRRTSGCDDIMGKLPFERGAKEEKKFPRSSSGISQGRRTKLIQIWLRLLEGGGEAEWVKCGEGPVRQKQDAVHYSSLCGLLVKWLESRLRPGWKKFGVLGSGVRTLLGSGNPILRWQGNDVIRVMVWEINLVLVSSVNQVAERLESGGLGGGQTDA